jgi:PAS domain S-box-containing protein
MIEAEGLAWFAGDAEGLDDFWRACAGHYRQAILETRRVLLERGVPQAVGVVHSDAEAAVQDAFWHQLVDRAVRTRDFAQVGSAFAEVGVRWSRANLPLKHWYAATDVFRQHMQRALFAFHRAQGADFPPERLERALSALHRYADSTGQMMAEEYVAERERLLNAQRKRTEEALAQQVRLTNSGIIGVFVSNFAGDVTEANDAFLDMLGYTRAELTALNWMALTPAEWSELDQVAIAQLRETGQTRPWEKEYLRKDGSRLPVLVGVAMLNDSQGIAFVLDISERKRLEELRLRSVELEVQRERFAVAARAKSAFVANLSHELRTPLTSIMGFAELLQDGNVPPESPQQREFLAAILTGAEHVVRLLNDVLDLSKVEAGKMQFKPEPVRVEALIAEIATMLRPRASERGVQLSYDVAPDLREVRLDPVRLRQVLYNLASNAIKFTPRSGSVRIEARGEGPEQFRLAVRDTGVGIPAEEQPLLFREFQQTSSAAHARERGTGLGLALTKVIVEAQGGRVGVESAPGVGSTFCVVLPRGIS